MVTDKDPNVVVSCSHESELLVVKRNYFVVLNITDFSIKICFSFYLNIFYFFNPRVFFIKVAFGS